MDSSRFVKRKLVSFGGTRHEAQLQQARTEKDSQKEVRQVQLLEDEEEDLPKTTKRTSQSKGTHSGPKVMQARMKKGQASAAVVATASGRSRQSKAATTPHSDDQEDVLWKVQSRGGEDISDASDEEDIEHSGSDGDEDIAVRDKEVALPPRNKKKGVPEARTLPVAKDKRQPTVKASKAATDSPLSEQTQQSKGKRPRQTNSGGSSYHTEDEHDSLSSPEKASGTKKLKSKGNKEYSKQECKRALAELKTALKLPPRRLTKEDFRTQFNLSSVGKNPHKLKIGKHIPIQVVEAVFGSEKGRNGYSLGDKLSVADCRGIEALYCICYQKEYAPNHVAKELAIGWVFDRVRKEEVDWAKFAADTNQLQQVNYRSRVRTWLKRLLAAGKKDIDVERDLEDFLKDTDGSKWKSKSLVPFKLPPPISLPAEDSKHKGFASMLPSLDFDMLASRSANMDSIVSQLELKVDGLQSNVDDVSLKLEEAQKESSFCYGMVEQLIKQFAKYGERYELPDANDSKDFPVEVLGNGPMHDMLRNNINDLQSLQSKTKALAREQKLLAERLQASKRYLSLLQTDQSSLQSGDLGCIMHPSPLRLSSSEIEGTPDFGIFPVPSFCIVCLEGFPFWHAIICSCHHLYHPWCAAAWFKDTSDCVAADCGRVHPMWLKAYGFSASYNEDRSGATRDCLAITGVGGAPNLESYITAPARSTLNYTLGPGSVPIGQGAPTASASGSTYSKCMTECADGAPLPLGQRPTQTGTSELSAKSPLRTPRSTQFQSPSTAQVPPSLDTLKECIDPSNNNLNLTPTVETANAPKNFVDPFARGDLDDILEKEDQAVEKTLPLTNENQVDETVEPTSSAPSITATLAPIVHVQAVPSKLDPYMQYFEEEEAKKKKVTEDNPDGLPLPQAVNPTLEVVNPLVYKSRTASKEKKTTGRSIDSAQEDKSTGDANVGGSLGRSKDNSGVTGKSSKGRSPTTSESPTRIPMKSRRSLKQIQKSSAIPAAISAEVAPTSKKGKVMKK